MKIPDYISVGEVRRVCRELKLRDWSRIENARISSEEARIVLKSVNRNKMAIPLEEFRLGLEVELEHGTRFEDANVTNNHPLITGRIVIAHLKESVDYYKRLEVAEAEGDLLKAISSGNLEKIKKYYRKLVAAKKHLSAVEAETIK